MDIELLVIPDCPHSESAAALLHTALVQLGLEAVRVRTTVIDTQAEAERRRFLGSPTIRIDGHDPFGEPARPPALACRVYAGAGGPSGLPDEAALRVALTRATGAPRSGLEE